MRGAARTMFAAILLLILGVQTRAVALLTLPILIGALSVHLPNGFVFSYPNGGWEYPAFLIVAAGVQALLGDGAFALSRLTGRARFLHSRTSCPDS